MANNLGKGTMLWATISGREPLYRQQSHEANQKGEEVNVWLQEKNMVKMVPNNDPFMDDEPKK